MSRIFRQFFVHVTNSKKSPSIIFKSSDAPFSSSSAVDLQRYFLSPRIHNLLHKLVSASDSKSLHEPKFRVDKEHNIKLLSDAELQAVRTLVK